MKKILKNCIYVVIFLYMIVWIDGSFPTSTILLGIISHLSYMLLFDTFPFVDLLTLRAITPILLTLCNHVLLFRHYVTSLTEEAHQRHQMYSDDDSNSSYKMSNISAHGLAGFFIVFVWAVPLTFLISMTDPEEALPHSSYNSSTTSSNNNSSYGYSDRSSKKKKTGFFRRMIDPFIAKSDVVLGDISTARGKDY